MKLKVRPARCLRRWYKNSECTLCMDFCPVNAITINGGNVVVDSSKCLLCGACASTCPAGVFSIGLEEILEDLVPGDNIKVSCREVGANTIVTCINALNSWHYIFLASKFNKILVDARCEGCPLSKEFGLKALQDAVKALGDKIEVIRGGGGPSPLIRRETIKRMIIRGASIASPPLGVIASITYPDPVEVIDLRSPEKIPTNFRVLSIEAARRMGFKLKLRHPVIDESKCTFCGICAGVCPTGAIEFEEAGILKINIIKCISCNHCIKLCPDNAMSIAESEEPTVLEYTRSMTVCPRCGYVYPSSLGECPKCATLLEIIKDIYEGDSRDCKEYGEKIREKLRSAR